MRTRTNLKPDDFTYAIAILTASGFESEKFGLLLHANAVVDGFGFGLFVESAVVDLYLKFSRIEMVRKVFDLMPERDTVLWNIMVSGLVRNYCFGDSIEVFQHMVKGGVKFNSTTSATVVKSPYKISHQRSITQTTKVVSNAANTEVRNTSQATCVAGNAAVADDKCVDQATKAATADDECTSQSTGIASKGLLSTAVLEILEAIPNHDFFIQ